MPASSSPGTRPDAPREANPHRHRQSGQRSAPLSFTAEQWVPYPLESVFALFSNPYNLPRLMPPWQDGRIDSLELVPAGEGSLRYAAGAGTRMLFSFRPVPLSPVRLRWLALIDEFLPDQRFCDMQVAGPFRYWRHCHQVAIEEQRGVVGTRITDAVDYAWPAGPFNRLVDALGGQLQLRQIFRYRQQQTLRLLKTQHGQTI